MKTLSVAVLMLALLGLAPVPSKAQVDVAKALVGKWEGQFQREAWDKKGNDVTLVIGRVREETGKWIVEGARFGPCATLS